MSTENSSSKWLIGCLIAGVVGMLLCAGGVALIGFWGYSAARQVAQQVGPEIQEQLEDMQFAAEWRPPARDAGPEEILPEAIGVWSRVSHDDSAAIPELAIALDGVHGTYEGTGNSIDVYTYRLPMANQAQLFQDALDAMDSAGYTSRTQTHVDLGTHHWMTFSFNPPQRYGRMWWAQDWLFVTMTDEPSVDLESFERIYLLTIQDPTNSGIDITLPEPAIEPRPADPEEPSAPAEPQPAEPAADETAPVEPETAPDDPEAAPGDPDAAPAEPIETAVD